MVKLMWKCIKICTISSALVHSLIRRVLEATQSQEITNEMKLLSCKKWLLAKQWTNQALKSVASCASWKTKLTRATWPHWWKRSCPLKCLIRQLPESKIKRSHQTRTLSLPSLSSSSWLPCLIWSVTFISWSVCTKLVTRLGSLSPFLPCLVLSMCAMCHWLLSRRIEASSRKKLSSSNSSTFCH